jgi:two-component system NtrC family sensor kinase
VTTGVEQASSLLPSRKAANAAESNGESRIPAYAAISQPVGRSGTAPEAGSRILVVDDEQRILDLFTDILEMMGHAVVTANNGNQAADRLNEDEYDLIICDIKMPGFSGEKLYNSVKETYPELAKHIIFVSGDTVNPETQSFLQSTGNPYIGKPFKVEDARQIILESLPEVERAVSL